MNKVTKKWDSVGLLEDKYRPLDDEEKEVLASLFEKGLELTQSKYVKEKISVLIFPAIKKIYSGTKDKNMDVRQLIRDFRKFLVSKSTKKIIDELSNYHNIDVEAEILNLFCDHEIIKFNNKEN